MKTALNEEEAANAKVLLNIGQAWELVYNPVQPEYRLNGREEQKIKWGGGLRILANIITNYFLK